MTKEDANYPKAKVFGILQSGHRLLVVEFNGEHSRGRGIYYRPIGGSIEFGEKSIDALIREFKEEVKEAVEIECFIACIENIFMINEQLGHEMILVYKVGFVNKKNYKRELFYLQENEKVSVAKWIDIMDFVKGEKVLFPDGLADKLERGIS
ncbi:NUDIX domain-containing protein [Sporosarcina luteola]|uniref:NUDIX hydrolase n=1 Tax=Sporosarcina luteola TaxID=582850 RepID=UPI00203BCB5D|nr:NUDIX domain-containing protein [Sporosarcina luteola]MCM3743709.1 NUDIX domain-containing protein [Sporosarcina luteola]